MTEKVAQSRRLWVVSPNVRDNNRTVGQWRQASVACKAAFMGYSPDNREHKQIGYKFAHVVRPKDIVLIARRYHDKPEVVGFGVVDGTFKRSLKGFKPPQSFRSLRKLRPFKHLTAAPRKLPIMDALGQTAALRELRPDKNPNHRLICDWMERKLAMKASANNRRVGNPEKMEAHLGKLPPESELEYEVRTRRKTLLARNIEAELVSKYRQWLEDGQLTLELLKYRNLRCDAYEEKRGNLIEAKCSAKREYIRMAVGQLLDYAYLGRERFGKPNMAILLPERPDLKSFEWVSELNISFVWKEKDVFLDNANGRFT